MAAPKRKTSKASEASGARILVVEARFYDDIADALAGRSRQGARRGAGAAGTASWCRARLRSRRRSPSRSMRPTRQKQPYDGAVALGCVIQGETFHFDIVAMQSARALMRPFGRAPISDRQRHPHRRHRGAGLGAGASDRGRQGRRRSARRACADRDQTPARQTVGAWRSAPHPKTDAAPTGAAQRGLRRCRRSTRWISRRRRCTKFSPSSRATGSAARSRASSICPPRPRSSAMWSAAWWRSSASSIR